MSTQGAGLQPGLDLDLGQEQLLQGRAARRRRRRGHGDAGPAQRERLAFVGKRKWITRLGCVIPIPRSITQPISNLLCHICLSVSCVGVDLLKKL